MLGKQSLPNILYNYFQIGFIRMPEYSTEDWTRFLAQFPDAHLLQTAIWGDFKASFGWEVKRIVKSDVGAQILFRPLGLGFKLAYIPKGPVGNPSQAFWEEIDKLCQQSKAAFLKVEPDRWEPNDHKKPISAPPGFQPSQHGIQPLRTILVDLHPDEDAILTRMKQKTRYNIRLARRKGVDVHPSEDIKTFHKMVQMTGHRDQFGVHTLAYYQQAYDRFHPQGMCELFIADYELEPLGGLMVFAYGHRAWYFYGASSDRHRKRMPNHLLQWEAMRWAKQRGCTEFDLWGVPDEDESTLEDQFTQRSDGLWGVYRFKRGFGGQIKRAAGPWDRVYQPIFYPIYRFWAGRLR
jgi:lipid II:glycine glycyltransferase (peptidoglycan interpeptide bridge formation enzyme)